MVLKKVMFVFMVGIVTIGLYSAHTSAHDWTAPGHEASQSNPKPGDQQSIQSGQALFSEYCSQCHGEDGKGLPAMTTQLRIDTPNLSKRLLSHSDGDFHWKIKTGRGEMAAFEKDLSKDEIWDIIHFIRSKAH